MSISISTKAKCLLLCVVLAAYASGARGQWTTWISNGASRSIRASTHYPIQESKFINRLIRPGTSDKDTYGWPYGIHIDVWVDGAVHYNTVKIGSDRSIVGYDRGDGSTGVDIYLAKYGTLFQTDGPAIGTIYLNSIHNTTVNSTTAMI